MKKLTLLSFLLILALGISLIGAQEVEAFDGYDWLELEEEQRTAALYGVISGFNYVAEYLGSEPVELSYSDCELIAPIITRAYRNSDVDRRKHVIDATLEIAENL